MRPKQRVYSLCPEAEKVITDRIGSSSTGSDSPSPSLVLNAILLRYDALVRGGEEHLLKKYEHDELEAFEVWAASITNAHLKLTKIDKPEQTETFRKLMEVGSANTGASVLDTSRRKILMRILKNNFKAPEMFTLVDRLCLKFSKQPNRQVTQKVTELEGEGG